MQGRRRGEGGNGSKESSKCGVTRNKMNIRCFMAKGMKLTMLWRCSVLQAADCCAEHRSYTVGAEGGLPKFQHITKGQFTCVYAVGSGCKSHSNPVAILNCGPFYAFKYLPPP